MTPDEARAIVAKKIAAEILAGFEYDWWGEYPDIGERDWCTVMDLVSTAVTPPAHAFYDAAYALLAARAEET